MCVLLVIHHHLQHCAHFPFSLPASKSALSTKIILSQVRLGKMESKMILYNILLDNLQGLLKKMTNGWLNFQSVVFVSLICMISEAEWGNLACSQRSLSEHFTRIETQLVGWPQPWQYMLSVTFKWPSTVGLSSVGGRRRALVVHYGTTVYTSHCVWLPWLGAVSGPWGILWSLEWVLIFSALLGSPLWSSVYVVFGS